MLNVNMFEKFCLQLCDETNSFRNSLEMNIYFRINK